MMILSLKLKVLVNVFFYQLLLLKLILQMLQYYLLFQKLLLVLFQDLEYSQGKILPALKEVRLSVSMSSKQPAPASYDPSQSLPIVWLNKVPNISIDVRERLSNLSQGSTSISSNGIQKNRQNLRHEVVLEVQNTGKSSIKHLELGVQYLDKHGNLIELEPPMFLSQQKDEALYTKTVYIGSSNDPMLNPGQNRVYQTSVTLKDTPLEDFKEYTITVVEVK